MHPSLKLFPNGKNTTGAPSRGSRPSSGAPCWGQARSGCRGAADKEEGRLRCFFYRKKLGGEAAHWGDRASKSSLRSKETLGALASTLLPLPAMGAHINCGRPTREGGGGGILGRPWFQTWLDVHHQCTHEEIPHLPRATRTLCPWTPLSGSSALRCLHIRGPIHFK